MSLCGCYPSCSCELNIGTPALLSLIGNGDPGTGGWTLSAVETTFSAAAADNAIAITPGGAYGHSPQIGLNIEDTDSVNLTIGAGGLSADVRIDPSSPIPINVNANGLSIDGIPASVDAVPTGTVLDFAGVIVPSGYLLCEGQEIDRAVYPDLDAVLSTTWGAYTDGAGNPGLTHFRLPDYRGRTSIGAGTGIGDGSSGNGLPSGPSPASDLTARTLADWGGGETHQLTASEMPSHTHPNDSSITPQGKTLPAGAHQHSPNAANRSFVTVASSPGTVTTATVNATVPAGSPAYPVTRYVAGSSGGPTTQAVSINEPCVVKINSSSRAQTDVAQTDSEADHTHDIPSAGEDADHNNVQPFIVTNKIIKT